MDNCTVPWREGSIGNRGTYDANKEVDDPVLWIRYVNEVNCTTPGSDSLRLVYTDQQSRKDQINYGEFNTMY